MDGAGAGVFVIILIAGYFIPTVIAFMRSHKDAPAIAAVNLLLGWSVIGWFMAFIWALSDPRGRGAAQTVIVNTTQHNMAPGYPQPGPEPAPLPTATMHRPPTDSSDDRDTAFWDSMGDKSDIDQLEEYLIRFPAGRFAALARNKLIRAGAAPAEAVLSAGPQVAAVELDPVLVGQDVGADNSVGPGCAECGAELEPRAKFCDACGASAAVATPAEPVT
ncbi:MAG: hypothetical protein JWR84_877 [Caulobacter sp.]|nr:hypothetical protein [Caulobacter sp.]